MKPTSQKIASCAFEIDQPGTQVQLLPDGLFRAEDGRPHDLPGWVLNARVAAGVLERARARRNDTVIDYEYQSLMLGKAPAWFHDLADCARLPLGGLGVWHEEAKRVARHQ